MATTKAITGNSQKNNGGTVVGGGNADTTNGPITRVLGRSDLFGVPIRGEDIGSKITVHTGLAKAKSAGALATMTAGEYVGKWMGTTLAGVATRVLNNNANYNISRMRPIHWRDSIRTRRIVTAGWNYVTGYPLTTPTAAEDTWVNIDGGTYVDHAATPTRALPGEFVFRDGSPAPKYNDYSEKTMG